MISAEGPGEPFPKMKNEKFFSYNPKALFLVSAADRTDSRPMLRCMREHITEEKLPVRAIKDGVTN
jgi:hypothetical protein